MSASSQRFWNNPILVAKCQNIHENAAVVGNRGGVLNNKTGLQRPNQSLSKDNVFCRLERRRISGLLRKSLDLCQLLIQQPRDRNCSRVLLVEEMSGTSPECFVPGGRRNFTFVPGHTMKCDLQSNESWLELLVSNHETPLCLLRALIGKWLNSR